MRGFLGIGYAGWGEREKEQQDIVGWDLNYPSSGLAKIHLYLDLICAISRITSLIIFAAYLSFENYDEGG
jgi:hypothetical protein